MEGRPVPRLTLDEIAARAREHTITPEEKRAQRISMMMGLRSSDSTLTREEVADLLIDLEGQAPVREPTE